MKPTGAGFFAILVVTLTACSGDGGSLGAALDPDADRLTPPPDIVTVKVAAVPGTDLGSMNLDRLARTLRDRLKLGAPTPGPSRRLELALTISRYDPGNAAGEASAGATHIDGWQLLTDPAIIAHAHRYRDRVADRDTFAWSRVYPSRTPIETVERDFAETFAVELFAPK